MTDPAAVRAAMAAAAPDAVVHLAAQASVAASQADPLGTYRVNYGGTLAVLEAAALVAPRARVLFVSSGQVYGPAAPGAPPFDESSPLRPGSPYDRTKAAGDLLAAHYAAARELDVVRARPFNHTGPGQADAFVASSFARQIAEIEAGVREPRLLVGNLEGARDFLDVGDVVDAYARLLERDVPAGAYNVASGRGVSARDVLETLLDRSSARSRIRVEVDPARVRPATASVGDSSKLRAATGWAPRVPLADTLGRLLEDWRGRARAGA